MLEKHPELKTEVLEIEKALQGYAESQAVEPTEELRSKILGSLETARIEKDPPVVSLTKTNSYFYKETFRALHILLESGG